MDMNSRNIMNFQNGAPATTQVGAYNTYVGARYVPIFDGEWSSTKQYEPLVIVTSDGDSYTSKQYVPAGTPVTNENFWAHTGNWNGQLESLRQQVNQNTSDITDIQDEIENSKDIYYLFIGDSYAETTRNTGWINKVVEYLGLGSNDYTSIALGGCGFEYVGSGGSNYNTAINALSQTILNKISCVVVQTAGNDFLNASKTAGDVAVMANTFSVNCYSKMPNLKRVICIPNFFKIVPVVIEQECFKLMQTYMSFEVPVNSPMFNHASAYYMDDNVHLTQDGVNNLANNICHWIKRDGKETIWNILTIKPSYSNVTGNVYTWMQNNEVVIRFDITVTFASGTYVYPIYNISNSVPSYWFSFINNSNQFVLNGVICRFSIADGVVRLIAGGELSGSLSLNQTVYSSITLQ